MSTQLRSVKEWIGYILERIHQFEGDFADKFVTRQGDTMSGELQFEGTPEGEAVIMLHGRKITGVRANFWEPEDVPNIEYVHNNFTPLEIEVDNPLE